MNQKLRAALLFDISRVRSLQNVRAQIMADNRRFAVIWSLIQVAYECYCLVMSFWKEWYALCRGVYIWGLVLAALAFIVAEIPTRRSPLWVYLSMLLNELALFGAGLFIAWILLRNGAMTIMVFAAALIAPVMFVNNTLLNIIMALFDIVAAFLLLRHGLSREIYGWCVTNLVIFSSMGVLLGHFVNKGRFERYVFAEDAVQLAESNAKLAELQTRYAYYDQMTELKNRRAYSEQIDRLAKEMPADCCAVAVDVNGLKRTNDMHGHEAGDELIVGTAECLSRSFEGIGTVYRLGGDEFCVLAEAAEEEVQKRLARLEKECAGWKGKRISGVSVSYGCASGAEFGSIGRVLQEADRRMYACKKRYYETSGLDRRKR